MVDEAQLLSWELLEEIRLLTNLETSQHKLLQIVLVGQPELDEKLDSPATAPAQAENRFPLRACSFGSRGVAGLHPSPAGTGRSEFTRRNDISRTKRLTSSTSIPGEFRAWRIRSVKTRSCPASAGRRKRSLLKSSRRSLQAFAWTCRRHHRCQLPAGVRRPEKDPANAGSHDERNGRWLRKAD